MFEKRPFEYSAPTLSRLDDYIRTLGEQGIYTIISPPYSDTTSPC